MFTLKIITASLNENGRSIIDYEYKHHTATLHITCADRTSDIITLLPGDTAYVVNGSGKTVATYTNANDQA
jgi:hypothetical protein